MTERSTFESRLQAALAAYAQDAPIAVEPAAMTRAAAMGAASGDVRVRPMVRSGTTRWLLVAVVGLLALALAAALVAGSRPPVPNLLVQVAPSPSAGATATSATAQTETPPPVAAVVEPTSAPLPGDASVGVGVGPCAPMVQFLSVYMQWEQDPPVVPGPVGGRANGQIVISDTKGATIALEAADDGTLTRVEPADVPPPGGPAYYTGFPMARGGRIVPSPDGRAIAVDQGDLGVAGCSEPVVKFAHGGMVQAFGARAFQAVRDVIWAPDGAALYGIRRPTIGANGEPLVTDIGVVPADPGTVVRWDAADRSVRDLGSPCGTCGLRQLAVSPDGRDLVIWTSQGTFVGGLDGAWRAIGDVPSGIGWTPDGLLVVDGYDHIDTVSLEGDVIITSGRICCHGNGYGGVLSSDGRTVVGSTLRADFVGRDIVTVDTATGEQRTIAVMHDPRGCAVMPVGSTRRADCEARGGPSFLPLRTIPEGRILTWSPDGRWLLIWSQEQDSTSAEVRVWSVDGSVIGPPLTLQVDPEPNLAPEGVWLPRD
jgi:hypothetical protein